MTHIRIIVAGKTIKGYRTKEDIQKVIDWTRERIKANELITLEDDTPCETSIHFEADDRIPGFGGSYSFQGRIENTGDNYKVVIY